MISQESAWCADPQTTCSFCYTTVASLAALLLPLPIPTAHTKIAISPTASRGHRWHWFNQGPSASESPRRSP